MGVILGYIPYDSSDLTFIDKLEPIGYTKKPIDKLKANSIREIFTEKPVDEIVTTGCIAVYRVILVSKKSEKVVGVAKVCFDCWAHKIVGTGGKTDGFGQNGDYGRLLKILRH
jgi:hypothetical protein